MRNPLGALVALPLAACGGDAATPGPCTACPDIAGAWTLRISTVDARQSTCGRLESLGADATVHLEQQGSVLRLVELETTGELREDGALGFAPYVGFTATSKEPYHATITAQLAGAAGAWTADGVLTAVLDADRCTLVAPAKLSWIRR